MLATKQRSVLITGSSQGLGKELVHVFANKGWKVWAGTRTPSSLHDLESNVYPIELDVTKTSSIESCFKKIAESGSSLDVLINNAGMGTFLPLIDTSEESMREMFDANVLGMLRASKAAIPLLVQTGGTIVNIGSVAGRHGARFCTCYCGTKWAVEGCTESLFFELRPLGIRVKAVHPGKILGTDFFNAMEEKQEQVSVHLLFSLAYKNFINRISQQGGCSVSKVANFVFESSTDVSDKIHYFVGVSIPMRAALFLRKISPSMFRRLLQRFYR